MSNDGQMAFIRRDAPTHGGEGRLRVVVFTSGPLLPVNHVLLERLAGDPLLDVRAIIVEEYERPSDQSARGILRHLRAEGWHWLYFKITSKLRFLVRRTGLFLFELMHQTNGTSECYQTLERETRIQVYRVSSVNSEESLSLIRSLQPRLGVIVGDRRPPGTAFSIPEYGTMSVQKGIAPREAQSRSVGYREVRTGERSIGVKITYVTPHADGGPVLAEATVSIEECDTLESLQIKVDIVGAKLYHDTIRKVALGERHGIPQNTWCDRPCSPHSESSVWHLQKHLKRKSAKTMPILRARPCRATRMRVFAQYAIVLPLLLHLRKRLIRDGRAPVCIFFYHVVANRPINHMCLPLEAFVAQIEFLRRYYEVIPLEDAVERLRSGRNDKIAISITFDDGYRDNEWAIEYLRYFGIPASFFVSIGHVQDGTVFEHDRHKGFEDAWPMSAAEVHRLASDGFVIGSHALYHENFGTLDPASADRVLRESRQLIGHVTGQVPEHFSFPKGQMGTNITKESLALAKKYYRYTYAAYGGYNFPSKNCEHFFRLANPIDVIELAMITDGYTGLRECLAGNAWGLKTCLPTPHHTK